MDPSWQQRFQYRPLPKAFLLNFPGIVSFACFRVAVFLPFLLILGQFIHGYNLQQLWWLSASPGAWLLGHALWRVSDVIFFHANRMEARRDERGFFLLLRPFKQTAATAVPGTPESPDPIGYILRGTHPLIWQYGVHLAPLGRLVAVGKVRLPKPVLSNDTVSVLAKDHNWMEIVCELAERCRAIIVLFDEGRGILEEIKHLSETGLTRKTIIRVSPLQPLAADPEASQQRWKEARNLLAEHGLHPPEAIPEWFLYVPKPDLSIQHQATLPQGTENALRELLALIPPNPTECSLREAMMIIDDFEWRTFGKSGAGATA
jgi:hypothetical protein